MLSFLKDIKGERRTEKVRLAKVKCYTDNKRNNLVKVAKCINAY